jgi:hypothetical protein
MSIPGNLIQETAAIGALPRVVCWGPQGGPYTPACTVNPLPVTSQLGTPTLLDEPRATPTAIPVGTFGHVWSGTAWDFDTGNLGAILLPRVARTATTTVGFTNTASKTLLLLLNVTAVPAAPGAGGLQMVLTGQDPAGLAYFIRTAAVPTHTAVGVYAYEFGAGVSGVASDGVVFRLPCLLPRLMNVQVRHLDAQSYTYNVSYFLGR